MGLSSDTVSRGVHPGWLVVNVATGSAVSGCRCPCRRAASHPSPTPGPSQSCAAGRARSGWLPCLAVLLAVGHVQHTLPLGLRQADGLLRTLAAASALRWLGLRQRCTVRGLMPSREHAASSPAPALGACCTSDSVSSRSARTTLRLLCCVCRPSPVPGVFSSTRRRRESKPPLEASGASAHPGQNTHRSCLGPGRSATPDALDAFRCSRGMLTRDAISHASTRHEPEPLAPGTAWGAKPARPRRGGAHGSARWRPSRLGSRWRGSRRASAWRSSLRVWC